MVSPFYDVYAHRPSRSFYGQDGSIQAGGVQIWKFRLGDLPPLRARNLTYFRSVGFSRPFYDPCCLFQQNGGRWSFGDERERSIGVDGNHYRNDRTFLVFSLSVKGLAEFHNVHPVLTEGRSYRGGRVRLPSGHVQLHH